MYKAYKVNEVYKVWQAPQAPRVNRALKAIPVRKVRRVRKATQVRKVCRVHKAFKVCKDPGAKKGLTVRTAKILPLTDFILTLQPLKRHTPQVKKATVTPLAPMTATQYTFGMLTKNSGQM